MQLIGVDCQIPSCKIHNEDILEMVKYYSASVFNGHLHDLETLVRRFLKITGINSRFWRGEKEKPIDLIRISVDRALKMAELVNKDINMVIYSGVSRGFIEPSNASVICNSLGMKHVKCFDIVDACMGWSSSMETADAYFSKDISLEYIMLINAEFPMDQKGAVLPVNFTIQDQTQLDWKAASFTLGEAVSVCILKRDRVDSRFFFLQRSEFASNCVIPLTSYDGYGIGTQFDTEQDIQFCANGTALYENGIKSACDILKDFFTKIDYIPKLIFPHSVSERIIQKAFSEVKINIEYHSTFAELGNLATASIPSAITKCLLNGIIKKGDKCVSWVASAGMKFACHDVCL
jgi:acyl-CoA:acyl-CoA alkyltransferase